MGADIQDINNDGSPDIFTTDMLPGNDYRLKTNTSFDNYDEFNLKKNRGFYNQFTQNALQVNNGNGKFLETAYYGGIAASDWSWGDSCLMQIMMAKLICMFVMASIMMLRTRILLIFLVMMWYSKW